MKFHQLTSEQRYTISILLQKEMSKKAIAEAISVHRSIVYREIERNSLKSINILFSYRHSGAGEVMKRAWKRLHHDAHDAAFGQYSKAFKPLFLLQ